MKISREEVEVFLDGRAPTDFDPEGRLRFTGEIRGIQVRVVQAIDRKNYVVTVHGRRR
ncbi:MAG: hypothetical protein M9938_09575 [Solirubrobacterales bacterium]|nr:hypothetical protein [Solirubrobacterales bacterium]